jgi:DNA repair exonuclease SbcCD ATPase subunit
MSYTLELSNFKTFEKFIFNIPISGLILIDGVSGAGKTSILQAFIFAITGLGKKISTYGTKKVKVELTKEDGDNYIKIIRQKSPDSLIVKTKDKEYHDDEAQSIIDNMFGKNFNSSSVIQQKGSMSFLTLSPKERLTQIENILFSDFSVENKKNKLKKMIKEAEEKVIEKSSKIDALEIVVKNKKIYDKTIPELKSIKECEEHKQELLESYNKRKLCVKELLEEKEILKTSLSVNDMNKEKINVLTSTLCTLTDNLEKNLEDLNKLPKEENIEELKKELNKSISYCKYTKIQKEIMKNKEEHLSLKESLLSNIYEEIKKLDISDNINDISSKIKSTELEIEKINSIIILKQRFNTLQSKVDERKKYIDSIDCDLIESELKEKENSISILLNKKKEYELSKTSLKCPCCSAVLKYVSSLHKLEKFDINIDYSINISELEDNLSKLRKDIEDNKKTLVTYNKVLDNLEMLERDRNNIQKELNDNALVLLEDLKLKLDCLKSECDGLKEMKSKITYNKNRVSQLEEYMEDLKRDNHPSLKNILDKVNFLVKQKKEIQIDKTLYVKEAFDENTNLIINVEQLENKISLLNDKIKDEVSNKKQRDIVSGNISSIVSQINDITQQKNNVKLMEIETEKDEMLKLEKVENFISIISKEIEEMDIHNTTNNIEKQMMYLTQCEEIDRIKLDITENRTEKDNYLLNTDRYRKLLKIIELSESKLIYKFIDTLNEKVNYHLDSMFEDPISININCFKDTKKGEKAQVDFNIVYKGNETELINLSGGEFDRLNMCFLLSFNELSDSNLIILDESLSSINQELVGNIIEHIQTCNKDSNKLVLMTLHQSIKGMFDKVISL